MAEQAGLIKEYDEHFLLDESKLRKIVHVLIEHSRRLKGETLLYFTIARENDSFLETCDVEEILQEDNSQGRAIRSLLIEVKDKNPRPGKPPESLNDHKTIAVLAFNRNKNPSMKFIVHGNDRDWCYLISSVRHVSQQSQLVIGVGSFIERRHFGKQLKQRRFLERRHAQDL
jgi:hypothetical protein